MNAMQARHIPVYLALVGAAATGRAAGPVPPSAGAEAWAGQGLNEVDMWGADMQARLGALGAHRVEARSQLEFSRGADQVGQTDTYALTVERGGNFAVRLQTPISQLEAVRLGEEVFVRFDWGHARQKSRRDMDVDVLPEMVWQLPSQCLAPFAAATQFGEGRPERAEGRAAVRYPLRLVPAAARAQHAAPAPRASLPLSPPTAAWRAKAVPLDVQGSLLVDAEAGLVLQAEVDGRLEIRDRPTQATQLRVQCNLRVVDLGRAGPVKALRGAVAEYRRVERSRDPLHFFRDRLPPPPAPTP